MKKIYNSCLVLIMLIAAKAIHAQSQTVGVFLNDSLAINGYTLFSPVTDEKTYLINNCGELINDWNFDNVPGMMAYLLEDGSIMRAGRLFSGFGAGGSGGRIERRSWDDELMWRFDYSDEQVKQHHDFEYLDNGNILLIAWERKSVLESVQAGRIPASVHSDGVWFEHIIEVKPIDVDSGEIVWEWHMFDHLIQDKNMLVDNFGVVSANPQKMDINYQAFSIFDPNGPGSPDWVHLNAIDYNPELDLIVISSRNTSEVYLIDHSTSTEEARSGSGGRYGMGGDFLFRWGNGSAYGNENIEAKNLFSQHDASWIQINGEYTGEISIFNNGIGREGDDLSSIEIIKPIVENGRFVFDTINAQFKLEEKQTIFPKANYNFTSPRISGVQVMENGHYFIASGNNGTIYEINKNGDLLWEYIVPISQGSITPQGIEPNLNDIFRALKYKTDYPAFTNRIIVPGDKIEGDGESYTCQIYDDIVSASKDQKAESKISIFPNPANDWIQLDLGSTLSYSFNILNINANVLLSAKNETNLRIDISTLNPGFYILQLTINSHEESIKFVKL